MARAATRRALRDATTTRSSWLQPQPAEPANDTPVTHLPLNRLVVSPLNVRTDARDIDATAALEASIAAHGLILPLVVHPLPADQFGVVAGQRRLRALERLAAAGRIAETYDVPVVLRDLPESELLELSAAENLLRRDLRDYEIFVAVKRAHEAGDDVAKLATALGQEAAWVRRALRLAGLHPTVFAAFAGDRLSLDQARAFAATEDTDLQLAVFERLDGLPDWDRSAAKIRAALGVGEAQAARLLRFVGDAAYRDAGGRFELDLFADAAETRGRVVDPEILRSLADVSLSAIRAETRGRARRDLRFVVQPPRNQYGTDHALEIVPDDGDLIKLPTGDIVATIDVLESGEAQVRFWWASRKAKEAKTGKSKSAPSTALARAQGAALQPAYASPGAVEQANAAIREAEGLSVTGVEALRSLRREAFRAMLVEASRGALKASVANDYLVFAQARQLLGNDSAATIGIGAIARNFGRVEPDAVRALVEPTPAHEFWDAARAELHREKFLTLADPVAAFKAYLDAPRAVKELAAAVVVGLVLERSLDADGYRVPMHDALALEISCGHVSDVDRALRHWVPPGEGLLGLLPVAELRALADPWIERVTAGKWQRLKRTELIRNVAALLTGKSDAFRTAGNKLAAIQWVHPLLRFGAADPASEAPAE